MEQWYVLQSKPNAEYQVVSVLQQRGLHTYLPEIVSPKMDRGCKRKPFFPCYLFLRVDFETVSLLSIQRTPGLRRVVSFDDRPTALPDAVIDQIWSRLNNFEAGGYPAHALQLGDTVRLIDGPFKGMLAIFDGPTTPAERVDVLLAFLGQVRRAQVPATYLEKTEPAAERIVSKRPRRTRGRGRWII
jgi:transcription elongation factor/antiterminator RfaH